MPGYDGTGPEGVGPNGRRLGPCSDRPAGYGRGFFGFRRGRRRGRGVFWGGGSALGGNEALNTEKNWLERELDAVNKQLEKLGEDKTGQ